MSDETSTRWSAIRSMAHGLWRLRLGLRDLRKKNARLQELMAETKRPPGVRPELWAKLAAAVEQVSARTIPTHRQRYRELLISAVQVVPRVLLVPMPKPPVPPGAACFLLDRLLPRADRNVLRGDMEEEFKTRLAKDGLTRARRWFWRETVWTIVQQNPIFRSVLAGELMRLGEWIFRQIGS